VWPTASGCMRTYTRTRGSSVDIRMPFWGDSDWRKGDVKGEERSWGCVQNLPFWHWFAVQARGSAFVEKLGILARHSDSNMSCRSLNHEADRAYLSSPTRSDRKESTVRQHG